MYGYLSLIGLVWVVLVFMGWELLLVCKFDWLFFEFGLVLFLVVGLMVVVVILLVLGFIIIDLVIGVLFLNVVLVYVLVVLIMVGWGLNGVYVMIVGWWFLG